MTEAASADSYFEPIPLKFKFLEVVRAEDSTKYPVSVGYVLATKAASGGLDSSCST